MTASSARAARSGLAQKRDTTINIRLTARMRDLIDSAASSVGKTRSEFILESASRQAIDMLLDQRLFSLGEAEYAAFVSALDHPPEPPRTASKIGRAHV